MDYELKLFKYRTAGVREYWIVDPKLRTIFVHYFEGNEMETYGFSDRIPAGIYRDTAEGGTGLEIDFSEIAESIRS